MLSKVSFRQKIYFVAALFIIIVSYMVLVAISRIGKTAVAIEVIPADSQVFIDSQPSSAGEIYLKPGTYDISAKKEGFREDKREIIVGQESLSVGLLPGPNSAQARQWLKSNPDIQLQREAIGGKMAEVEGGYEADKTPILRYLPYTDLSGPFTIDFGYSKSRSYGTFLEINHSTPKGREAALAWIRSKGFDPTDLEIRYTNDFKNPLLPVDTVEGELEGPNE